MAGAAENADNLLLLMNTKQIATGRQSDFQETINQLKAEESYLSNQISRDPVSYTHLDVYKRQAPARAARQKQEETAPQMTFGSAAASEIEAALRAIDVNTLTPIEAMNKLYELKTLLKD